MKYAVTIIAAFARNAHMKRALHEVDADPSLYFWRLTYGNCLDMAVIEWCKLFGSDDEAHQPVHWKNAVSPTEHDEFRRGLLDATNQTDDEWQAYWERMKGYRDKHAAHFDESYLRPEDSPQYPDLTIALEAAYYYYDRLLRIMEDRAIAHRFPSDIRAYCRRFAKQATEAATKAIASTAAMEEKVR